MRRKSERSAANKKVKSPEKKPDKLKRSKTKKHKSTSSDNESVDESSQEKEVSGLKDQEHSQEQTSKTESQIAEAQDQVWQVKTAESSNDSGEIKKLKICLTRPPSTPDSLDCSPRSKRKHSRATSSSDTASVEAVDDKKKSKHRSRRLTRESKDDNDKMDVDGLEAHVESDKIVNEVSGNKGSTCESATENFPVSTTNDDSTLDQIDNKVNKFSTQSETKNIENISFASEQEKAPIVDTTVVSPLPNQSEVVNDDEKSQCARDSSALDEATKQNVTVDAEEKQCTPSEVKNVNVTVLEDQSEPSELKSDLCVSEVSVDKSENSLAKDGDNIETNKLLIDSDVENSGTVEKDCKQLESCDLLNKEVNNSHLEGEKKEIQRSDSVQSIEEDIVHNGAARIVINRKRRWGLRTTKLSTQKSITISTDILKEIIPDVKPAEFVEVIEEKKHKRVDMADKLERPVLPKIVIDNTESIEQFRNEYNDKVQEKGKTKDINLATHRKISIVKDNESVITRPPSPPRNKPSCILYITNLVRPFTLPQLKNLLQRTGRIVDDGFWIDRIKSKCYVQYETEDQAIETRHALHGVQWPVSNPKTLQVDFSNQEAFENAKANEETDSAQTPTVPGTVEDWLREQDLKRERGELEKPWERKAVVREWDVGKNGKEKEKEKLRKEEHLQDKRRHRTPERSPEPARKFKKKEEEAPAKLLDDLFKKTKTTPCIYWLPLSAETIAIKEEQRRKHMLEHERRLQELRRTHRRH